MKKEILYYSILLIIISTLLFFQTDLFDGNTQKYSKVINIESFDKLDIDLACNIYVSIGEEQKVVFEGPEKYVSLVETKLENGILKISAREAGIFSKLFRTKNHEAESLNLYIKLTDANQLLTPKKGNLISNETFLYLELECDEKLNLNVSLRKILQLLGNQFGVIRIL